MLHSIRQHGAVNLQTVHPRKLAAVRREVAPGEVGSAWGPALGKVWEFIRSQPGLRTDGHNIFLYRHPTQPGTPILCDFGVEVTSTFETAGDVYAIETQGGEAAVAVHRGPYNRMNEAHDAIRKCMAANRRESAGHSWEIYGDPAPDPADTPSRVFSYSGFGLFQPAWKRVFSDTTGFVYCKMSIASRFRKSGKLVEGQLPCCPVSWISSAPKYRLFANQWLLHTRSVKRLTSAMSVPSRSRPIQIL
jgi:hypothetical protein